MKKTFGHNTSQRMLVARQMSTVINIRSYDSTLQTAPLRINGLLQPVRRSKFSHSKIIRVHTYVYTCVHVAVAHARHTRTVSDIHSEAEQDQENKTQATQM